MKRLATLLFFTAFFMTSAFVYSDSYDNDIVYEQGNYDDDQDDSQSHNQGHSAKDKDLLSAYNAPARIDVNGSFDLFITGSYIYWQPKVKDLIIARSIYLNNQGTSEYTFRKISPDYTSGFKVGIGKNFKYDNWCAYFEYTRFHSSDNMSFTLEDTVNGTLQPTWLSSDNFGRNNFLTATGKWILHMDMMDLELSRPFYLGTKLIFIPHAGFRGGWLDQKIQAEYIPTADTTVTIHSNNDFDNWLFGPRAGIDANWELGVGFRLFTNIATALLYQSNTVKLYQENYTDPTTADINEIYKPTQITPNLEAALGLGWGTYFDKNNWHFDLCIGYEFHIFWKQNLLRKVMNTNFAPVLTKSNDLNLHGLLVTGRFDF